MAAGGMLGVDVERAEFMALLEGLQLILQEANLADVKARAYLLLNPIRLTWFSDRESLVHSVTRGDDGQPINKRTASADLWARFEFYEPMFRISAFHLPRNTNPNQAVADQISSDLRTLLKDYFELPHNQIQSLTTEQAAASIRAAFGLPIHVNPPVCSPR